MISIEKAKILKELGLIWNPKCGDWYKADYWPTPTLMSIDTFRLDDIEIKMVIENIKKSENNNIFSLVGEKLTLFKKLNLVIQFECESREDSVADALIWILECKQV